MPMSKRIAKMYRKEHLNLYSVSEVEEDSDLAFEIQILSDVPIQKEIQPSNVEKIITKIALSNTKFNSGLQSGEL